MFYNWLNDLKINIKLFFSKKANWFHLFISILLINLITILFRFTLPKNELKHGIEISDELLNILPSYDLSDLTFVVFYSSILLSVIFLIAYPKHLMYSLNFLFISLLVRFISLFIIQLEYHDSIIPLIDPILLNSTYDGIVIKKDLFFSGHITTLCTFYYSINNKTIKRIQLFICILISILLILQHVHFSIDIVGAFFIVSLINKLFYQKVINNLNYNYSISNFEKTINK